MNKKKTIFFTSGFGFLGGSLASFFSEKDFKIILGTRKKIDSPTWCRGAETISIDWNNLESLSDILKKTDVVIHTAGMNANDCNNNPSEAIHFNGLITLKLVKLCKKIGVKKFIFFSSAHVYRNKLIGYIDESTLPTNNHPYAISKIAAENNILNIKDNNFYYVIFRLSNVIGLPMDKNMNCWSLFTNDIPRQAAINGKIVIKGNGEDQRDLITMKNLYEILITYIDDKISFPKIINIAGGNTYKVIEIAKIISEYHKRITGNECQIFLKNKIIAEKIESLQYVSKYNLFNTTSKKDICETIYKIYDFCKKIEINHLVST